MRFEIKKNCKQFKACLTTREFVEANSEFENYVLVYSKSLAKIYGDEVLADGIDDKNQFEGLVKVCCGKKVVYRKCIARKGFSKDEMGIGYRTLMKLGISNGGDTEFVCVMPTNWFCYLWHHNNSVVRGPFIFAFFSLIFSILGIIVSIVCGINN